MRRARRSRGGRLGLVDGVLRLQHQQRPGAQIEIAAPARSAPHLPVRRERPARRIILIRPGQQREPAQLRLHPRPERRQRIGRATSIQIRCRQHRPAHRRVQKYRRALADHEFLVQALQPHPHIHLPRDDLLLIPRLPQPRGRRRTYPAHGLQIAQIILAQAAAAQLQRAHIHLPAIPAKGLRAIHLHRQRAGRVIGRAPPHPAGGIAKHLLRIGQQHRHPMCGKRRTHPAGIAEQIGLGRRICGLRHSLPRGQHGRPPQQRTRKSQTAHRGNSVRPWRTTRDRYWDSRAGPTRVVPPSTTSVCPVT